MVISTAHWLFVDREGLQFVMPDSWESFIVFLKEARYTGIVACALALQVAKKKLKVVFFFVFVFVFVYFW